jgi:hypothetical protein
VSPTSQDNNFTTTEYETTQTSSPSETPSNAKGWLKMSAEELVNYRSVKDIEYAFIQAFAAAGIIGNTFIMAVIGRYKSVSSPHVYMLALAFCDILICISGSWKLNVERFNHLSDSIYAFTVYTYWYVISVDSGASIAASLVPTFLSMDRCFALLHPLKHKRICSVLKVKVVSGIIVTLSLIVGFNYVLRFNVKFPGRFGAYTVNGQFQRSLGFSKQFHQACSFIEFILRFILPLTIMAVSNTWTLAVIRKSNMFRKKHASTSTDHRSTKCLATTVGLVILFFCTQLVHAGITFDGILFGREHRGSLFSETIFISGNVLVKANSVVNFFVYLILGREFRREFLGMIGCGGDNKAKNAAVESSATITISSTLT